MQDAENWLQQLARLPPLCQETLMARKLRVQYPGAIYHVMNRGDHSEAIFRNNDDRNLFLGTLAEACGKTDWQVHSYCLMSNHFHLVTVSGVRTAYFQFWRGAHLTFAQPGENKKEGSGQRFSTTGRKAGAIS